MVNYGWLDPPFLVGAFAMTTAQLLVWSNDVSSNSVSSNSASSNEVGRAGVGRVSVVRFSVATLIRPLRPKGLRVDVYLITPRHDITLALTAVKQHGHK